MPLENQGGPAPASAPPAATTQQTVSIPLEQLQAFTSVQARLAEMEAAQRAQQEATRQEQARILAQKGEVENALRMLREQSEQTLSAERQKFAQVEERAKRYALDGEVSRTLAAHNLVPGGAEQLAPSLAEPVRGRCPGRVLRRAHADVPDGGRVRLRSSSPGRSMPTSSGRQNPGGHGHRPDDPGGPDAPRRPDTRAAAEEHGRGGHPPHAGHPEGTGRRPGQHEPTDGTEGRTVTDSGQWSMISGQSNSPFSALRGQAGRRRPRREPRAGHMESGAAGGRSGLH